MKIKTYDARGNGDGDTVCTLTGGHQNRITDYTAIAVGGDVMKVVRRLTPEECESLQGFEKGWTLIGEPRREMVKDYAFKYDDDFNVIEKTEVGEHEETVYYYTRKDGTKKKVTDSERYMALGNSIATGENSFWMWIVKRMSAQYDRTPTMCSLFDGIGGFPLVWAMTNGLKSCVWNSEIEEFPEAVSTAHFGDEDRGIEGDFYRILEARDRRFAQYMNEPQEAE